MSYRILSSYQIKPRDVSCVVHPLMINQYLRQFHIKRNIEMDKVLVVDRLPRNNSVLDHFGKVRNDVPFSLRCHLRSLTGEAGQRLGSLGGSRSSQDSYAEPKRELSEYEKLEPLSASVVEYEKRQMSASVSSSQLSVGDSSIPTFEKTPITRGSKAIQALDDSWELECSLEDELNNNHQDVVILDMEDSHKLLNNFWVDLGKDTALLAKSISSANGWLQHTAPIFDAKGLVKQFGDINIKADIVESKGKQFMAFSGKKNGKEILHALVNGTRINMNGKKYPIDSPKVQQVGLSPKARMNGFKGAGALTFVVSAAIATTDLVFKDDYHLVDWFGNVGSDMFKALLQFGAGEALLFIVLYLGGTILVGLLFVVAAYVTIEWLWGNYKVNDDIVKELKSVVEN